MSLTPEKRRAWYRRRKDQHRCPWCGDRTDGHVLCEGCRRHMARTGALRRKDRKREKDAG